MSFAARGPRKPATTGYREAIAAAGRLERRRSGQHAESVDRRDGSVVVRFRGRYIRVDDAVVVLGRLSESVAAEVSAAGFVMVGEDAGKQLWIRHR